MVKSIQIIFLTEVMKMKMAKDIALMGLGAGALLAYQKYNKPVMNKARGVAHKTMKAANDKLEDMM